MRPGNGDDGEGITVIEEILPAGVMSAEAFDDTGVPDLFPAERALVANAVDSRRREFGTARRCARIAPIARHCQRRNKAD